MDLVALAVLVLEWEMPLSVVEDGGLVMVPVPVAARASQAVARTVWSELLARWGEF
jgi:hypothetical protein